MSASQMILPVLDGSTRDHWRDVRLPRPYAGHDGPSPVGQYQRTEQCPDGRHLFDLLQTSGNYRSRDVEDDAETHVEGDVDVRLTGTCVRCGLIWRFEGTEQDKSMSGAGRISPEPLRAGELRGQEVDRSTWFGDIPRSTYSVHTAGDPAVLGWMSWGRTRRGREFYTGRLTAWPTGQTVEAPTPIACLRKLARAATGGAL